MRRLLSDSIKQALVICNGTHLAPTTTQVSTPKGTANVAQNCTEVAASPENKQNGIYFIYADSRTVQVRNIFYTIDHFSEFINSRCIVISKRKYLWEATDSQSNLLVCLARLSMITCRKDLLVFGGSTLQWLGWQIFSWLLC